MPDRSDQPDRAAFERAMLPHLASAYRTASWLTRDRALAEDVVQDAFVRALGAFGQWRGREARGWLLQIVRRVAFDALARRRHPAAGSAVDEAALLALADPAEDPEAALRRRQDEGRLMALLDALPDELRECVVLRELEGCSYQEVSEITGVPIGTVMSRLWRGRQRLLAGAGRLAE